MTKRETTIYLAGLCDGEAYFGIKKTSPYKHLTGRVNPGYSERIQVRMVDEPAIKLLAETFGGWYYKEQPHVTKRRPLFCYQASDLKAVEIIKALLPYLRVKRTVAEKVLALRVLKDNPESKYLRIQIMSRWKKLITVNRKRHSDKHIAACDELWLTCKTLNRVGT